MYTSRSTWAADTTNIANIDFEGIAPSAGVVNYTTGTPLTLSGVTFVGSDPYNSVYSMAVVDSARSNGGVLAYDWGSGAVLQALANYDGNFCCYVTANLPGNTTAVGLDIMGFVTDANFNITGYNMSVDVGFYDASNNLLDSTRIFVLPRPTRAFVGEISATAIDHVVLQADTTTGAYAYPEYDNFSFAPATPEPGTFGLVATAILFAAVRFGRKPKVG